MNILEEINIKIWKEGKWFLAKVNWDDGTSWCTQGLNYPELYMMIKDLFDLKLKEDKD